MGRARSGADDGEDFKICFDSLQTASKPPARKEITSCRLGAGTVAIIKASGHSEPLSVSWVEVLSQNIYKWDARG